MSRFYQTTATELQDDFIFQPDWEMAKQAVAKQDEIAGEAISTMEMMGNPLFEFDMEADGLAAERVKDMWEGTINDIARQISDISDPRELKKIVGKARRDLQKDYEFGEIRALEDNARKIREYEEAVKALPPSEQEFWRQHLDEYREMGGGAAIDTGKFKEQGIYDIDLSIVAFASSPFAQAIKPNIKGELRMREDGKWIKTDGVTSEIVTEEDVMERYQAWVKNQRGIEGRIEYGERFGEDNWRDEDGNIRFDDESFLGSKAKEGIKQLAYSNIDEQYTKRLSEEYLQNQMINEQRRQRAEDREYQRRQNNMQLGFNKYDEAFGELTEEGRKINEHYKKEKNRLILQSDPGKYTLLYEAQLGLNPGEKFDPYDVDPKLTGKAKEEAIRERKNRQMEAFKYASEQTEFFAMQDPEYGPIISALEDQRRAALTTGSDMFLSMYPSADLAKVHEQLNGPVVRGELPKMKGTISFGRGEDGKFTGFDVNNSKEAEGKRYTGEGPYKGWIITKIEHAEGGNTFNHFGNNDKAGNRVIEFNSNIVIGLRRPHPENEKDDNIKVGPGIKSDVDEAEVYGDFMTRESNVILRGYY